MGAREDRGMIGFMKDIVHSFIMGLAKAPIEILKLSLAREVYEELPANQRHFSAISHAAAS